MYSCTYKIENSICSRPAVAIWALVNGGRLAHVTFTGERSIVFVYADEEVDEEVRIIDSTLYYCDFKCQEHHDLALREGMWRQFHEKIWLNIDEYEILKVMVE